MSPIQVNVVSTASTKLTPMAAMPTSEPWRGRRLPKNRMATNEAAMMAGINQTLS